MRLRRWSILAAVLLAAAPAWASTMEFVSVGNPGNAADSTGYGAVGYEYRIGKYEVTNAQYCQFLNAVAKSDTNGLYHIWMSSQTAGGINQAGTDGSHVYTVKQGYENRPVNCVTFWDVARFANWMHNGMPTGAQTAATTEDGAYTLTGIVDFNTSQVGRNANAKYWLPSENEWYKAAYYNEQGAYSLYPTRSNSLPSGDAPAGGSNSANWKEGNTYVDSSHITTEVGAYADTTSYCGAYDMAGNVWEWNDTVTGWSSSNSAIIARGYRGAGANSRTDGMRSSYRGVYYSQQSIGIDIGFRIATVPEPTTIGLFTLAATGLIRLRKK